MKIVNLIESPIYFFLSILMGPNASFDYRKVSV